MAKGGFLLFPGRIPEIICAIGTAQILAGPKVLCRSAGSRQRRGSRFKSWKIQPYDQAVGPSESNPDEGDECQSCGSALMVSADR